MWCMGGDESVCVALSDALKSTITLFKNRDLLACLLLREMLWSFQRWRWNGRRLLERV
jgi:hypothetical protein